MAKKKLDKKIILLEPTFSDILTCQRKELLPFLEIIIQTGENVSQESLGRLLGIFSIRDRSEDSSYIVNYIISIIKKEYFSRGKRGAIESFESALHKANLALSKLAQHGNINWIGKFDALVAVIEKNNLHFSQAGKATALLLRNQVLTNISEGMSEEDTPNPLKTFTSISSGKLEENDKLILSGPEIFDIFSMEEIRRSILRFSNEDFLQFLKTALGNELETSAVLVSDIHKKKLIREKSAPNKSSLNAFSQNTFVPKTNSEKDHRDIMENLEELIRNDAKKETLGHIYIKEATEVNHDIMSTQSTSLIEKGLGSFWKRSPRQKKIRSNTQQSEIIGIKENRKKNYFLLNYVRKKIREKEVGQKLRRLLNLIGRKFWFFIEITSIKIKNGVVDTIKKLKEINRNCPSPEDIRLEKNELVWKAHSIGLIKKIKSFSRQQKIYALIIIFLVFIVPFFIVKTENHFSLFLKENSTIDNTSNIDTSQLVPEDSLNQNISPTLAIPGSDFLGIINLNEASFAVKKSSLVRVSDQSVYNLPEDFGNVSHFTAMNDLGLILLMNNNYRIISFYPDSRKFQENSISFPDNLSVEDIGTFMTYLYVLDSQNNKIYRYPRAEGGFGSRSDWLKETTDLSGYENMSLTDGIYLFGQRGYAKFFRGKKEDLNLENRPSENTINWLLAQENALYVLDRITGTIIQYDLTGKITRKFSSDRLKEASQFSVSSDRRTIYFISSDGLYLAGIE